MIAVSVVLKLTCCAQVFVPTVVLRQQAFSSVQEQTAGTSALHIPGAWSVGADNAVSLTIGAGVLPMW